MPLLRIWNSLFGRPADQPSPLEAVSSEVSDDRDVSGDSPDRTRRCVPPTAEAPSSATAVSASMGKLSGSTGKNETGAPAVVAAKKRGWFSGEGRLGGGRGAPELRKLAKQIQVSKVLEIFVGDGSRTVSALQALSATEPLEGRSYTVIDSFPGDAGDALKSFHRRIRQQNAQVKVIPGSMEAGLQRVAWTIGAVDLVLIGEPEENWSTVTTNHWLQRVCHPQTVVLVHDGQGWRPYHSTPVSAGRVAA